MGLSLQETLWKHPKQSCAGMGVCPSSSVLQEISDTTLLESALQDETLRSCLEPPRLRTCKANSPGRSCTRRAWTPPTARRCRPRAGGSRTSRKKKLQHNHKSTCPRASTNKLGSPKQNVGSGKAFCIPADRDAGRMMRLEARHSSSGTPRCSLPVNASPKHQCNCTCSPDLTWFCQSAAKRQGEDVR